MSKMDNGNKEKDPPVGLECRRCGCRHFYVIYTRPGRNCITRRRECRYCGLRVSTREFFA